MTIESTDAGQDGVGQYRKIALIHARQWWKLGDHPAVVLKSGRNRYADEDIPWIETLEGGHVVTPGDWIATGIKGEHWPIKADIFAATYEPVDTRPTPSPAAVEVERIIRSAIDRTLRAETDPVLSFKIEYRQAEKRAAIADAIAALSKTTPADGDPA